MLGIDALPCDADGSTVATMDDLFSAPVASADQTGA
jgi:hypothetical protein